MVFCARKLIQIFGIGSSPLPDLVIRQKAIFSVFNSMTNLNSEVISRSRMASIALGTICSILLCVLCWWHGTGDAPRKMEWNSTYVSLLACIARLFESRPLPRSITDT